MGILINEMLINRHPQEEMVIGKVAEVIKTCTHVDPNRRYKNIAELRIAFAKAMAVAPRLYAVEKTKLKKQDYIFHIGVLVFAFFYFTTVKDTYTWIDKINQTLTVVSFFYFGYWITKNKWHLQEVTPLHKAKYKGIRFVNGLMIWLGCVFLFMFTLVLLNEVVSSMLAAYQILLK